jgi:cysteine-rich repeat protein
VAEYCGDGVTNNNETCDDGALNGTGDGKCLLDCSAVQSCGNGVTNGTEQCDTSGESSTCDSNCTLASCGDGDLNTTSGEACDDGNRLNGDGCSKTCAVTYLPLYCGEAAGTYGDGSAGAAYTSQQIEDLLFWINGATQAQIDACTYVDSTEAAALFNGKPYHAIGTIGSDEATGAQAGHIDSASGISEAASDNDLVGLRNCVTATQTCSEVCGNGILNSGEECDDGGQTADCNSDCTLAGCGDGVVNTSAGESCDDGNTVSGDGCNSICKEEFSYELWFTANYEAGTSDTTCDNGTRTMCADLISLIRGAEETIDFAIYGNSLDMNMVADALSDAQDNGVVVRGIVDVQNTTFCNQSSACGGEGQPACATYSYSQTQAFVDELASGTVKCDNGIGSGYIMHDKFFVIDGYKVWTGTTNVSRMCIGGEGNANTSILVNSWRVAKAYVDEVDQMWTNDVSHNEKTDKSAGLLENFADGSTVVKQYFAPKADVTNSAIIPAIAAAEETIDVQMFYLTSQTITDALIDAYQRGVSVRLIIDAGGDVSAYDRSSCKTCDGNPDEAGYIETSVEIGMDFLCNYLDEDGSGSNNPVMIVKTDPWGGKQHNKTAVIDSGVPGHGAVIIGSQNWTNAGEDANDENLLYIKNDAVAAEMQADFNMKWNSTALQGVNACSYVAQEGNSSSDCVDDKCDTACNFGSCCDSVDNDMDGNIDAADNGCRD